MRIAGYIAMGAAVFLLPACGGSGAGQSTIGRQALSVARESRQEAGTSYSIGPQYEDEMSLMISREAAALGMEESKEGVPMELNREVLLNINYFLNNARGFMTRSLSRGSKYIPMMKAIFRQKGLPEDLVYLALIESGFQTAAVSRASAVGPWQFISSTGRRYGLTINEYVDERMDPVKSTYAAADYLTALHDMFNSWPLAIAAYNSGEGKILRGMKNYGVSNFWDMSDVSGHLADETRLYVPSFLAATFIAKDPGAYGLEFEALPPDQWDEAVLPSPLSFDEAASMAGTSAGRLAELNPHLKKKATPPDEADFVLRIPAGSLKAFADAYQKSAPEMAMVRRGETAPPVPDRGEGRKIAAAAPQSGEKSPTAARARRGQAKAAASPRLATITHKVQRGDTLASIARLYGVPMDSIKSNNSMKSNTVYRGQILRVKSDLPLTAAAPQRSRGRVMVVESKTPSAQATGSYTVRKGDTLGGIARQYGMSARELADINKIKGVTIRAGQKLKVRGQAKAEANASPAGASLHTVAKGDTLGEIALKYKISEKELSQLNGLTDARIRVGQKLRLSAPAPKPPKEESPKAAPKAHKVASGETIYSIARKYNMSAPQLLALNPKITDNKIRAGQSLSLANQAAHKVARGDTLYSIAAKNKMTVEALRKLNGLSGDTLKIGQTLKLR